MRQQHRQRQERARQAAYDRIERQKAAGLLTIRQMTPEERERWGPPPETKPAKRKRAPVELVNDDGHAAGEDVRGAA